MYTNIKTKKLPDSEIEITGTLEASALMKYKKEALTRLNSLVHLDGFRKGHIPENILTKHVGEKVLLEEMAEIAIAHSYPKIVTEEKIFAIGRPSISFTKLEAGSPADFSITVAVLPTIEIADYKKIATTENKKPKEAIDVSENEIDEVVLEIRKSQVDHSKHDHSLSKEEHDKQLEKEAPELTEAFVKKIGDFKTIEAFKEKVKENIAKEKESRTQEKKRIAIVDAIIESSTLEVPRILIEGELNKMTEQFKADIGRMGATFEAYLEQAKKTEADVRKDWEKDAVKRVKLQLLLNKIASDEKLEVPKEEIEKEVGHITAHYKDADPERARDYAETILTNEMVLRFLEGQV
jgi:FKBP-type peptidyl-prolyl cis-trans isomerase (trigger factor)